MKDSALRVSARGLVEFSIFPPDILPVSMQAMELGRQGHIARQGESPAKAETHLRWEGNALGMDVVVTGRMDLYDPDASPPMIEEIKLSPPTAPEAPRPEHLMQAVCYGFMLCRQEGFSRVELCVSYVTPAGSLTAEFKEVWDARQLEQAFMGLLLPYAAFQQKRRQHLEKRKASLENLPFPYPTYRLGQREMAAQVYTAIDRKKRLFAVMPTGTGKSAAVLYPALKALGKGLTLQIFCLTARGTQRLAMQKELDRMLSQGLVAHALTLNAKEGLCPMEHLRCHPDHCERAKGHFLRQGAAREEALLTPVWDGALIHQLSEKHSLCPFEFSLSLCEFADVVICDYNYALDPQVRLSRVFDHVRKLTLLVDEAHNLPDRARESLSGRISQRQLREFRRVAGKLHGRTGALYKALTGLMKALEEDGLAEGQTEDVRAKVDSLLNALGTTFTPGAMHLVRDLVCLKGALLRHMEQSEDYAILHRADKTGGHLSVLCLNPAPHLEMVTRRLSGVVFYSATLKPLNALRSLLGGDREDACLALPSPFPEEHLLCLQMPLNTRFKARGQSLGQAALAIQTLFMVRPGKMIAYFPSFAYLGMVQEELQRMAPSLPLMPQAVGMDEARRREFLDAFTKDEAPLLGLCVLGGVFSEGVDLPGKALTAVAILGVGLPQLNEERALFQQRMEEVMGDGFGFAYRYPGMHKVLQAAGRLIRSETDRGVLLLLDDRYAWEEYSQLLPPHYRVKRVHSMEEIQDNAGAFWQEASEGGENLG